MSVWLGPLWSQPSTPVRVATTRGEDEYIYNVYVLFRKYMFSCGGFQFGRGSQHNNLHISIISERRHTQETRPNRRRPRSTRGRTERRRRICGLITLRQHYNNAAPRALFRGPGLCAAHARACLALPDTIHGQLLPSRPSSKALHGSCTHAIRVHSRNGW